MNTLDDEKVLARAAEITRKREREREHGRQEQERARKRAAVEQKKEEIDRYNALIKELNPFLEKYEHVTVWQIADGDDGLLSAPAVKVYEGYLPDTKHLGPIDGVLPVVLVERDRTKVLDSPFEQQRHDQKIFSFELEERRDVLKHPDPKDSFWAKYMRRIRVVAHSTYAQRFVEHGERAPRMFIDEFGERTAMPAVPVLAECHYTGDFSDRRVIGSQSSGCAKWLDKLMRAVVTNGDVRTLSSLFSCGLLDSLSGDELQEFAYESIALNGHRVLGLLLQQASIADTPVPDEIVKDDNGFTFLSLRVYDKGVRTLIEWAVFSKCFECVRVLRAFGFDIGSDEYIPYWEEPGVDDECTFAELLQRTACIELREAFADDLAKWTN